MRVKGNKLPLADNDFGNIRSRGKVYVDKTRMIYDLADSEDPIFLSRPRRFGKSLLVSTFESLFSRGLEDFKGLKIEKLWKEEKTYPILRFEFNSLARNDAATFARALSTHLKQYLEPFGFKSDYSGIDEVLTGFGIWLSRQETGSLVLLIDEYDAPLTRLLNKKKDFEDVLGVLSTFYANIKNNKRVFRFIFVTGIARFQKASIFSEMNIFTDITLMSEFGDIVGYTQEELERYFGPYIDNAAKVLEMSRAEILDRMKEQYDGFCFDEKGKYRLYAPWSVLSFLKFPSSGLKNYWSDSGGKPSVLLEYFADHVIKSPADYEKQQDISMNDLTALSTIDAINPLALLTQAGYFTIDYAEGNSYYLRYPNGEVRETMAELYTEILYKRNREKLKPLDGLQRAISSRDAEKFCEIFNTAILNIPHGENCPLDNEAQIRGYMVVVLDSQGILVIAEKANAKGSADIVAIKGDDCVVIELKYCYDKSEKPHESADALLKKAVSQIKENRYGEELRIKNILRIAMVFSENERKFVKWQVVDIETGQ